MGSCRIGPVIYIYIIKVASYPCVNLIKIIFWYLLEASGEHEQRLSMSSLGIGTAHYLSLNGYIEAMIDWSSSSSKVYVLHLNIFTSSFKGNSNLSGKYLD